jgi:hypothetical protein
MSESPSQSSSIEALEQSKSKALEQSISQLQAYHAERSAQRRAQYAEDARMQDKFRDLLLGQLRSNEVELKQLAADQHRFIERRAELIGRPLLAKGKLPIPRFPADTASVTKGAPYDQAYTLPGGQGKVESADINTGTYDLRVQSIGNGDQAVGAGIGFWFSSDAAGNPWQRFTAIVDFSFDWWDTAAAYVAHNNAHTWLTVWGMSEGGWVGWSVDETPSWSDGVGWYENHGNSQSARAALVTFFNTQPNSLYFCWVQSGADAYADSGVFGSAASSIHIMNTVAFAVID